MIDFIIWNESPVAFSAGPFVLRWYVLLFIVGFLAGRQLLAYIYKKEGKPLADVEALTIYVLIAALIGARLGYVVFYEPDLIWTRPLEVFLPFQFQPTFRFTGLEKLSGYGAILASILSIWFYGRRKKEGQNFLQVFDRMLIVVALVAAFIGAGNFLNAEITGKPTESKMGVVFMRSVTDGLLKLPCCVMRTPGGPNPLESVSVKKDTALTSNTIGHSRLLLYLFYKTGATEQLVKEFLIGDVKTFLYDNSELIYESGEEPLHYTIFEEQVDVFAGRVRTTGIARHPTQIYEAAFYLALSLLLFWIWKKNKNATRAGRISGVFLVTAGLFNFGIGFLKETQASFEKSMVLNVGQLISVAIVCFGAILMASSFRKRAAK